MTDLTQKVADDLQREAARIFLYPNKGLDAVMAARLVECIVQAAVLRMAELQSQYAATGQTADVPG